MNRREFLLAVGVTACSGGTRTPTVPPTGSGSGSSATPQDGIKDLTSTASNVGANPLAFFGDVLVQRVGNELWKWDATAMRRTDRLAIDPLAFAWLADGTLVVERRTPEADCALYRIASDGRTQSATTTCGDTHGERMLLRAATNDLIYSVRYDEIVLFKFARTSLEAVESIPVPSKNLRNRSQMFSLDDGRIVTCGSGISVLAPGAATKTFAKGTLFYGHLARANGDRLWYSAAAEANSTALDRLVLARIDDPLQDILAFELAPARIVHMASFQAGVAMLLALPDRTWAVAVVDDSKTERWRVNVPAAADSRSSLNERGAVALSATRLVLRGHGEALFAWDAQTGKPIAVTAPTD